MFSKKCFSLGLQSVKSNLSTVGQPWKKSFGHLLEKSTILPPLGKNPSDTHESI